MCCVANDTCRHLLRRSEAAFELACAHDALRARLHLHGASKGMGVKGLGLGDWGLGFGVWRLGFRCLGVLGFRDSGVRVLGLVLGFRVRD